MNNSAVPIQARIWHLSLGFANTAVLHALVKTGVIERLRGGPRGLLELARSCNLNQDVLRRTLRFATAIDIVKRDGNEYVLSETGRLLLKDVPGSLFMGLLLVGSEPWQRPWHNLAHALRTGENTFTPTMGSDFFEFLEGHPEYGEPYNQWMTISTNQAAGAIVDAYDFSPFETVCDVGGGQGILLKHILAANPQVRGVLYDQQSVVKDHVLRGFGQRVEIRAGSIFERVPAADVLVLKSVLHDWSDERCQVILENCRDVLQPSSRLLIVDMVISSPTDVMGAFYDLHMQVLLGGRERTEADFRSLLDHVGMRLHRVIPTRSPMKIIEASL